MPVNILKYFILLLLGLHSLDNYAEPKILIGYVYAQQDSLPLSRVNVFNVSQNKGAITSEKGRFFVNYEYGDSIQVSSIGYKTMFITPSDSALEIKIYLRIATFILDEVTIQNKNKYQDYQFKKDEKDFTDWAKKLSLPNSGYTPPSDKPFERVMNAMSSPLSALYSALSKKEKEKKEYYALLQEDYFTAYVSTIYNKDLVKQVTSLVNDEEIEAFMDFCRLNDSFVLNASQYDLMNAISNCYKSFKKR